MKLAFKNRETPHENRKRAGKKIQPCVFFEAGAIFLAGVPVF
jgi:hypothetical protein